MNDLEGLLRARLAGLEEPPLAPPPGLAAALRRRHDRRRAAVPVAAAGVGVAAVAAGAALVLGGAPVARVATAPSSPPATPPPPRTGPSLDVAGVTFVAPEGFRVTQPVARKGSDDGTATSAVVADGRRTISLAVFDGALAAEWGVRPPGTTRVTTISGYPAKVSRFTGSVPSRGGDVPGEYVQVLVRLSATRTVFVLAHEVDESTVVGLVREALDRR
jgi:hypothetical protein